MWWARLLNNVLGVLSTPTPPVTNSYESIATVLVGSGGTSSITFGAGNTIPQTYKHLQIRALHFNSAPITDMKGTFNSDTGANYSNHLLYGTGSGAAQAGGAGNTSYANVGVTGALINQGGSATIIDILDYQNTNKFKTVRTLSGFDTNSTTCFIVLESSAWRSTSAITQIDIAPQSGTINEYSSFALYGIKG